MSLNNIVYKLPDGRYIDLLSVVSIKYERETYRGLVIFQCQLMDRDIHCYLYDDDNVYGINSVKKKEQDERLYSQFDKILKAWQRVVK